MAVEVKPTPGEQPEAPQRPFYEPIGNEAFPPPNMGRTVHVVGTVVNVDPEETPHPRVRRGEMGKALFNYMRNTINKDPIARISSSRARDQRNVFTTLLRGSKGGQNNPEKTPVPDPAAMTRHIKRVAHTFGADIVGVGRVHPSFLYGSGALHEVGFLTSRDDSTMSQEELCEKYPYVIVTPVAWDYDLAQAHRHHIGDAAYEVTLMNLGLVLTQLEGYIRELGYTVIRGKVNPQAAALAAGVGELGRNGLIISEKFGARIHLNDVILTDLPLVPDKPLDIGVEDFCKICRKCAETCPTNSITFGPKQIYNGVEKYKIKWESCYKLRPLMTENWSICLTCSTVCPYTKPNTWWRTLAVRTLHSTPVPLRPAVVRSLKWIDDRFWGKVPRKRVRWLGYDSGVKPGATACTVAGCTAQHGEAEQKIIPLEEIGYYAPLKENVNRFVKRS
jgi:reductive dehalogenase